MFHMIENHTIKYKHKEYKISFRFEMCLVYIHLSMHIYLFLYSNSPRKQTKKTTKASPPKKGAAWKEGRVGQQTEESNCCSAAAGHKKTMQRAKHHGLATSKGRTRPNLNSMSKAEVQASLGSRATSEKKQKNTQQF